MNRTAIACLILTGVLIGPGLLRAADAQDAGSAAGPASEVTPPRVSYLYGEVSFWRPGAADWAPAQLNTPLAPGDAFYTGPDGNVEIQMAPGAFVRGSYGTQIGLDNQDPDYIQLRLTGGRVALDLRTLPSGTTVELDTPNAAFTVEHAGYYHIDVDEHSTALAAYRGGSAIVTPAGGAPATVGSSQQIVISGTDSVQVTASAAPTLTAWDHWNDQRTRYLMNAASARHVAPAVYGTEALDQYGAWRSVPTYGSVWVPSSVPAGWVPYSAGRWIWDPRFGWTWLDDAPWGWAPYHHGRWVFVDGFWAWAPGPIVVRPVYAPALVVFLGGGTVVVGRPVHWAPLAWGEPVIPWWGRPGFAGRPSWAGWGGPRVVNNVVVDRSRTVNVTNVTVYRNVNVTNAVVGVQSEQFGRERFHAAKAERAEVQHLKPVQGAPDVKPVAASVAPATGPAVKPPDTVRRRPVVATRPPADLTPALREHGLAPRHERGPDAAPRLVPSPKRAAVPSGQEGAPTSPPGGPRPAGSGREGTVDRPATSAPKGGQPPREGPNDRPATSTPRGAQSPRERALDRPAAPGPSSGPREGAVDRPASPPAPTGAQHPSDRSLDRPTPPPPSGSRPAQEGRERSVDRPATPSAPTGQPGTVPPRERAVDRPTTPTPPSASRPLPPPRESTGTEAPKAPGTERPGASRATPRHEASPPESRKARDADRQAPTPAPGPPPLSRHEPAAPAPPSGQKAATPPRDQTAPDVRRGPAAGGPPTPTQQPPASAPGSVRAAPQPPQAPPSRQRGGPDRAKGEAAEQATPGTPNAPKPGAQQ